MKTKFRLHRLLLAGCFSLFPIGNLALADPGFYKGGCGPGAYMGGMMGPGMMGGAGMMGPGMIGPGMMGGAGLMGPGMMGGAGMMGPGMMMGYGGLDLSDKQRSEYVKILREARKTHMQMMDRMFDLQMKLQDAWQAKNPDPAKLGSAYIEMAKQMREMRESWVSERKKFLGVLTKEQKEKLENGSWGMGWGGGNGPMRGARHMMMQ